MKQNVETSFPDNGTFKIYFQRKWRFHWRRRQPLWLSCYGCGELDGIGNLVDLPRLIFIDGECGNLKVVIINNDRKKSSEVLQAYRC